MLQTDYTAITTRKSYLVEEKFEGLAKVVECIDGERPIIRIEETDFHPQGGGQKSDRGNIGPAKVLHVAHNGSTVDHYVDSIEGIELGKNYSFSIDSAWRHLNSVYHSAGHLIASTVETLYPSLTAIAGHQWPGEARVDFISNETSEMPSLISVELIQKEIDSALAQKLLVQISGDPFKTREIIIGTFQGIPCGGTHIQSLSEISKIKITQIKSKSGKIRVSYDAILP